MFVRMIKIWLSFGLFLVVVAGVVSYNIVPHYDDPDAYRAALAFSINPRAFRYRQVIADGPRDLAKAESALSAEGISLKIINHPIPASENAAPLYIRWWKLRSADQKNVLVWDSPLTLHFRYTAAQISQVEMIEKNNSRTDELLLRAVTMPGVYVHMTTERDEFALVEAMRAASREIKTKATLLALDGQWNEAIQMQSQEFNIARQSSGENGLIGFLAASAQLDSGLSGLESILTRIPPNGDMDESVIAAVKSSANTLSLKRSLIGQIPILIQEVNTRTVDNTSPADRLFYEKITDERYAQYLNDYRAVLRFASEPTQLRRADMLANEKRAALLNKDIDDPIVRFAGQFHGVGTAVKFDDSDAANEQIVLAGATVLSIKAATGRFPAALPGAFVDPFNGKSLGYGLTRAGFVVYSVGPSGKFNGMTEQAGGWDRPFVYPAPPPIPLPAEMLQN